MTKSEASKLEEKPDLKLVRALQKDFKALYNPQYTANHKVKQMLINLEISIMRLDNIESLINKQRQEARIDELKGLLHEGVCEVMCGWSKTCDKKPDCVPVRKRLKELESKEEAK